MRYAFFTFFIIIGILSLLIIKPFITTILASLIVVYIFYPLYAILNRRFKSKNLSASITMLVIMIIFGLLIYAFASQLYGEISRFDYESSVSHLDSFCYNNDDLLCKSGSYVYDLLNTPEIKNSFLSGISKISTSFIVSIPSILLNLLIFIVLTFYMFKEGEYVIRYAEEAIHLKREFKTSLWKQVNDVFYSTVYGAIIVSIIQGMVAIIALIVFGSTTSPFLWGILIIVGSFIPFIGSAIIWLPIGVLQIINGYFSSSSSEIWKGVGLLVIGGIMISTIDNILKPMIVGKRAGMHPMLVMIGAFGGIALMGIVGIFIGPLILAFLISFIDVYKREKKTIFKE
jgi:predicted PurR-regulated permease PerM